MPESIEKKYFLTVDRCNQGRRGLFTDRQGHGFIKDTPHTDEEMHDILDLFYIVLNPKSEPFTENDLKKFNKWIPLAEYKREYGIAVKPITVLEPVVTA